MEEKGNYLIEHRKYGDKGKKELANLVRSLHITKREKKIGTLIKSKSKQAQLMAKISGVWKNFNCFNIFVTEMCILSLMAQLHSLLAKLDVSELSDP